MILVSLYWYRPNLKSLDRYFFIIFSTSCELYPTDNKAAVIAPVLVLAKRSILGNKPGLVTCVYRIYRKYWKFSHFKWCIYKSFSNVQKSGRTHGEISAISIRECYKLHYKIVKILLLNISKCSWNQSIEWITKISDIFPWCKSCGHRTCTLPGHLDSVLFSVFRWMNCQYWYETLNTRVHWTFSYSLMRKLTRTVSHVQ